MGKNNKNLHVIDTIGHSEKIKRYITRDFILHTLPDIEQKWVCVRRFLDSHISNTYNPSR